MEESQQMMIKEGIIEYMKNKAWVERSVDEIKSYVEQHKVRIDKGSSALRNALFSLKRENPSLINVRRGVYVWKEENGKKDNTISKYDFSDFVTISNSKKRENNLVISIFQDGTFSLNSSLLHYLPERKVEIKLKQDCSQLAIIKKGNMKIDLGKNGRIKNYDIVKRLEKQKKKFPIYYVGSWDDQEEIWIGNITTNNPNKKNVRRKKNIK